MKERGKGFIAGLLVSAILAGTIGTAAATIGSRTVKADYADIKIVLNGNQITPQDANGKEVEPFAINGTTYLPVRAVANALGMGVDWNGETSTVILTETNENVDSVLKLGFYKILSESFTDLKDNLDGILNGSAKLTIHTVLQEGPYAGMTFADAMQTKLKETEEIVDSHYAACSGLLSKDDIVMLTDYSLLNWKVAAMFEDIAAGRQTYTTSEITQAYVDAFSYELNADSMFWQEYQSVFN